MTSSQRGEAEDNTSGFLCACWQRGENRHARRRGQRAEIIIVTRHDGAAAAAAAVAQWTMFAQSEERTVASQFSRKHSFRAVASRRMSDNWPFYSRFPNLNCHPAETIGSCLVLMQHTHWKLSISCHHQISTQDIRVDGKQPIQIQICCRYMVQVKMEIAKSRLKPSATCRAHRGHCLPPSQISGFEAHLLLLLFLLLLLSTFVR